MNFSLTIQTEDAGMVAAIANIAAMMAENATDQEMGVDLEDGIHTVLWFTDSIRYVLLGDPDIFSISDSANAKLLLLARGLQGAADVITAGLQKAC
jgi:hypothetical protein